MSIGRNTFYNLVGTGVPTVLALVTVPAYLRLIGPERYGVLAIAWLVLGYFGVFDLGLGRATAQRISALRDDTADARATAFGTALVSNLFVGVVGALIMWPASYLMFSMEMKLTPGLRYETLMALPLLALAVPVATTLGVFSGALMAREKFYTTNRISIVNTCLFQILPLTVAWYFGPNMTTLLAASIAARMVGLVLYWAECNREFGADAIRRFDRGQLRQLLSYGGWITVAAVFNPFVVVVDRFLIGAMLGSYAVTVYVVPTQLTSRVLTISGALCNALFPRMAVASGEDAERLARDAVGVQLALMTPLIGGAYVLMQNAMEFWVGHKLGIDATPIARILMLTAWINMFSNVPFSRLQASGRPDLVTKVMLVQLPVYLIALYYGVLIWGVWGAAMVYFVRYMVDLTALNWVSSRRFDHFYAIVGALAAFGLIELALPHVPLALTARLPLAVVVGLLFSIQSWFVLPPQLQARVTNRLRGIGRLRGD
jgi:O-antigen/teichoic acid export membrane protein